MTAHIEAEKGSIARTVIMPGDPMRAKFIAENYLKDYKLVNEIRGMYAYTGYYKNILVTVMASGMGMPSIGIYSYELYKEYDVENIIRVGTAGAYSEKLNVYDLVLAGSCYSESSFAKTQNGCQENVLYASDELNNCIEKTAKEMGKNLLISRVHSSDVFYKENDNFQLLYKKYGCVAGEMESFALFHNANILHKNAACLLTISNSLATGEETTALERQTAFTSMIELALESATKL